MTIEEVISSGEVYNLTTTDFLLNNVAPVVCLCLAVLFIMYLVLHFRIKSENKSGKETIETTVLTQLFATALVFSWVFCIGYTLHQSSKLGDGIDEWKKDVALPYIEKEGTIYNYHLNLLKVKDGVSQNDLKNTIPLTIMYKENDKDKEVVTITSNMKLLFDLEKDAEPYYQYKTPHVDLGNSIKTGDKYFEEVHVPKDYKFNDK